MQRGMDGKGRKNAMPLSAGCAGVPWLLRSQTADVATSRRHALTQTHIGGEHIENNGVNRSGRETKGVMWVTMVVMHYMHKNQR